MTAIDTDVIIVGAGPAGDAAHQFPATGIGVISACSTRSTASPGLPPPANPPAPRIPRCEKPCEPGSGPPTP